MTWPDEGVSADSGIVASPKQEDKLVELTGLVKSLIWPQAARDQKLEKHLSCQD